MIIIKKSIFNQNTLKYTHIIEEKDGANALSHRIPNF